MAELRVSEGVEEYVKSMLPSFAFRDFWLVILVSWARFWKIVWQVISPPAELAILYFVVIIGIERLISWEVAQIDTRMANLQQSLIISLPCQRGAVHPWGDDNIACKASFLTAQIGRDSCKCRIDSDMLWWEYCCNSTYIYIKLLKFLYCQDATALRDENCMCETQSVRDMLCFTNLVGQKLSKKIQDVFLTRR